MGSTFTLSLGPQNGRPRDRPSCSLARVLAFTVTAVLLAIATTAFAVATLTGLGVN